MVSDPPQRQLRILMLHGYTQSGSLFHAKTRALEKNLEKTFPPSSKSSSDSNNKSSNKSSSNNNESLPAYPGGIHLSYPTAPIHLSPAQIPGFETTVANTDGAETDAWGWWVRRGDAEPFVYEGIEQGLEKVAQVLKEEGPFDGVVGFSQGGALAGMVAALLEKGRRKSWEKVEGGMEFPAAFLKSGGGGGGGGQIQPGTGNGTRNGGEGDEEMVHPPMKFAVSYSGFGATTNKLYMPFYEPKIATPMLHFLGSVDTVVEEARSLRLVDSCVNGRGGTNGGVPRVVYHPGGHFVPATQKQCFAALVGFIKESVGAEDGGVVSKEKEESAEDMNMPF